MLCYHVELKLWVNFKHLVIYTTWIRNEFELFLTVQRNAGGKSILWGKTNQSPQQALWTKMTWSYTTVNGLDHSGRRRIQKNIALVNKLLPFKCLFYWLVLQLPLRHTIGILASIDIPHLISLGKYSIWRVLANLSTSK